MAGPLAAQEFFTLKGHGGPIMDIAVAPNGQIATASFDNSVGLWDGERPRWFEGHRAAVTALSYDAAPALLSGGDDFRVLMWHPGNDGPVEVTKHLGKVSAIAVSPDGRLVASAGWDGFVNVSGMPQSDTPQDDAQPTVLKGHRSNVTAVAYGPENALYSASSDGTLRIWEGTAPVLRSRTLVKHGFGINRMIVTADWIAYGAVDGGTRIVDAKTGDQIADFTLDRRPILSMAFHAPSRQLAVGDGQGYIMVIDTDTLKISRDFRATRQGPIWALAFSPDGENIHAGGIEDTVYSWPVDTMDEHGPMQGTTRSFLEKPESLPNGERQFKRKCSICHTLTAGSARKAGPSLHQVFGRKAGTVPDYTYSDTLNGSDIVWSAETINALFDIGPDHYIPGTKMPMQRIVKPSDRDDLIDFLRSATAQEEN
ncbi:cytochrome c [Sulfitobacter noctilucicola]|uniref:Cytochrome c n=2 Tax=Sulfitobacter noctilucicola TaxID=1342301 RepID=A0A7W6MC42_9RHOB|nr:cytochrome c [Sulfitobacter noctilucicola]